MLFDLDRFSHLLNYISCWNSICSIPISISSCAPLTSVVGMISAISSVLSRKAGLSQMAYVNATLRPPQVLLLESCYSTYIALLTEFLPLTNQPHIIVSANNNRLFNAFFLFGLSVHRTTKRNGFTC